MTLQDRLREAYLSHGINYVQEAADRIDALEQALRETLFCLDHCMVFITSRQKIKEPEGHTWIAESTKHARAALGRGS